MHNECDRIAKALNQEENEKLTQIKVSQNFNSHLKFTTN